MVANDPKHMMIAKGKHSLSKIAIYALGVLANRENLLEPLSESLDCFGIAIQLLDDVRDWEEDYLKRRYSYVILQLLSCSHLDVVECEWPSLDEIKKVIASSDILESALEQSNSWLYKAIKAVNDMRCKYWIRYLENGVKTNKSIIEYSVRKKLTFLFEPLL